MKAAVLRFSAAAFAMMATGATGTEFPPGAGGHGNQWQPFAPVERPPVPPVQRAGWGRNPIDAFIAAQHTARKLQPRPEAPRAVLLRRLYLDLVGLPPNLQEQRAFLADSSPSAYEKVVDRLLASPHYGERWGRHWMDIWRYSDRDLKPVKDGTQIPEDMWRWRDWIVESLNANQGYDTMVMHMLAGDELAPTDRKALCATGYLARNKADSRDVWLHATVDHTLQAFAGLAIQCARCHDHPVDPITQIEYYQLRALFEPISVRSDPVDPNRNAKKGGFPRVYDANANAKTWLYIRGNELQPDKENPISPGVPAMIKGPPLEIEPVTMPPEARTGKSSSGRRRAFARWLGDRDHPSTARVAVNHIWGRHFGRALAPTVNDFGAGRQTPTHPALLDWLAADLMEHGWKMKRLHRLIVTSATYRLASTPPADGQAPRQVDIDPDNHFLWRFTPRRMEAELVRDAILSVSGRLDPALGGALFEADRGNEDLRRSLYFRGGPNTQLPLLTTFDGAVVQECYRRRHSVQPQQALALLNSRLVLESARHLARSLHRQAGDDAAAFLDHAFSITLSRPPIDEERRICADYLEEQGELFHENEAAQRGTTDKMDQLRRPSSNPTLRARENLVQLLLNHHEFLMIR